MLAQPGHPVFVDTLGRIMQDIERHRQIGTAAAEDGQIEGEQDMAMAVVSRIGRQAMSAE
jgi:hypothetical protein